jgi:hypothetical protein
VAYVVLSWSHDFVLWVIEELVPVRKPSNNSRNHEEYGEHIGWESHSFINDTTIEVDIGIEFSLNKVRIGESNTFEFDCDFD